MASTTASITKFTGDNWSTWAFETRVILKGLDLYDIVSGDKNQPKGEAEKAAWVKEDAKAQSIIVTRMEAGPQTHILSCETANEMWTKLKTVYDRDSVVNAHLLHQKIFALQLGQDSMSTFFSKIEEIKFKLKQAGEEISEKMVITKILMALPEPYKHFRSAWESAPTEKQTLAELTSRLLLEEEREKSSSSVEVPTALLSRSTSNCPTCGRAGHTKDECFKNKRCDFCKKLGHVSRYCFFRKEINKKKNEDNEVTALMVGEPSNNEHCWFMDSGCTHHMWYNKDYFENYKIVSHTRMVKLGDGAKVRVIGEGNVKLKAFDGHNWSLVRLDNVLHVPDLTVNLFSVTSALDNGLNLLLDSRRCTIMKNNKTVAIAKRSGKLFRMCFRKDMKTFPVEREDIIAPGRIIPGKATIPNVFEIDLIESKLESACVEETIGLENFIEESNIIDPVLEKSVYEDPLGEIIDEESQENENESLESNVQKDEGTGTDSPYIESRPQRKTGTPKRYDDYETCFVVTDPEEPGASNDSSPDASTWNHTIKAELSAPAVYETWSLAETLKAKKVSKIKRKKKRN